MANAVGPTPGQISIAEIQLFGTFAAGTQRYIRRSLDIGLHRQDASMRWSRDVVEETSIRAQSRIYERLDVVRAHIPHESGLEALEGFIAPLITISAFDLAQGRLPSFAAYEFLYERLLGARVRPWLAATFSAAASMPHLHPDRRRLLMKSLPDAMLTATSWSGREPSFYPQWVEKVDETRSATDGP